MSKKKYAPENNRTFSGCRCSLAAVNGWRDNNCGHVPEFGIATHGQLERLACDFVNWALDTGNAVVVDGVLRITNGHNIMPEAMAQAIKICAEEGKPNLVERYRTYLENLRKNIL